MTLTVLEWLVGVAILAGLGWLFRIPIVIMLAGFVLLIYGFSLWTAAWYLSVAVAASGAAMIYVGNKA